MAVARHLDQSGTILCQAPDSAPHTEVAQRVPEHALRTRVNLLHTWIDKVDMAEAARRISDFVRLGGPQQVVTVNLDFLRLANSDHSFRDLINAAGLVVPDGMPLIWATRLLRDSLPERVAGVDLVLECAKVAAEKGYSIFLLGAADGVAEKAAATLRGRCPGLQVAGTYAPPTTSPEDDEETLARVQVAQPDILFVAFGAPRQDQWIHKHMRTLGVPVCIGVGGAFDMLSGRVSRAPGWMQRAGLEWFYRFLMEPGRLWKRYFVQDLPILLQLIAWSLVGPRFGRTAQLASRHEMEHPSMAVESLEVTAELPSGEDGSGLGLSPAVFPAAQSSIWPIDRAMR